LPEVIYAITGDGKGVKHALYLSERNVKLKLAQGRRWRPKGIRDDQRIYWLASADDNGIYWEDVTERFISE
jgi:hypothetical protein